MKLKTRCFTRSVQWLQHLASDVIFFRRRNISVYSQVPVTIIWFTWVFIRSISKLWAKTNSKRCSMKRTQRQQHGSQTGFHKLRALITLSGGKDKRKCPLLCYLPLPLRDCELNWVLPAAAPSVVTWGNTTTRGCKTKTQLYILQKRNTRWFIKISLKQNASCSNSPAKREIILPKVEASIFVYLPRRWGSRRSFPCGHSWRSGRSALSHGPYRGARSTVSGRNHRPTLSHGPYCGARSTVPGRHHRATGTTSSTGLTENVQEQLCNKTLILRPFCRQPISTLRPVFRFGDAPSVSWIPRLVYDARCLFGDADVCTGRSVHHSHSVSWSSVHTNFSWAGTHYLPVNIQ